MKEPKEYRLRLGMEWVIFSLAGLLAFVAFVPYGLHLLLSIAVVVMLVVLGLKLFGIDVSMDARIQEQDNDDDFFP